MVEFFDRRNLIYGDWSFIFDIVSPPYVVVALGDYHDGYLIDVSFLSLLSDEIFFIPVYNKRQFRVALKQSTSLGIPILILNVERLFGIGDFHLLNFFMHDVLSRCDSTIFITTRAMRSKRYPPPPLVSHYIRHLVDVVIFSRKGRRGYFLYLVKHPFLPFSRLIWRDGDGKEFSLLSFISEDSDRGHRKSQEIS